MLASGQASAQALARSRTIEALVLKRSKACVQQDRFKYFLSVEAYRHGSCQAFGARQLG